jgi:hypothetical protein
LRAVPTEAPEPLVDLLEISSQIEGVVLIGDNGATAAAGLLPERADAFARAAAVLLDAARAERDAELAHVEVDLRDGSVVVVCESGRTIAAVTAPEPTSGLVLYDLRACLRRLATADEPPKRRKRKREDADAPS